MKSGDFRHRLKKWYDENKRDLPWRKTKDPYAIWLSEIILQQTRVRQGISYYLKILEHFPDVSSLARASEQEVLSLWQGLGYYSRARNLHKAAHVIAGNSGKFPDSYEELIKLPGIGPYTAAAIASFAFDLPHAVMDGNVMRVMARLYAIDLPINTGNAQAVIREKLDFLFDRNDAGIFNQAIMEFGALHCTISSPGCPACPFSEHCQAFRMGRTDEIPCKEKKGKRRKRYFNYLVLENEDEVVLRKRKGKDIWENLYDFPMLESTEEEELVLGRFSEELVPYAHTAVGKSELIRHVLSHQDIMAKFWRYKVENLTELALNDWEVIRKRDLENYPLPKLIENYLNEH